MSVCDECWGCTVVRCPECQGTGDIGGCCIECGGTGEVLCENCDGIGYFAYDDEGDEFDESEEIEVTE